MSNENDNTENLTAQEGTAPQREKPARRWASTTERVRQHPVGVAIGSGVAGLIAGGLLTAALFGGSAGDVGPAGMSTHYSAQGEVCPPGPPPPGGQFGGPPGPPAGGPGGPGGQFGGPPPPPPAGQPGPAAPGGPGQGGPAGPGRGGPGAQPAPAQQPGGGAPGPAPATPLLPAEQPAR